MAKNLRQPRTKTFQPAFENMQESRGEWTRTIEKTKCAHREEYIDKAGEGHLWKAATYMRSLDDYASTPALSVNAEEVEYNEAKAKAFLDSFFF
jgi:hypothetical protein